MNTAVGFSIPCRACGQFGLRNVLSLGHTPLANALLTREQLKQPEPTFPLDLVFCPACTLLQITESVRPEQLFGEYLYFSSFSDTMLAHSQNLVERLIAEHSLSTNSLVVEIASNDGYLLQFYRQRRIPVLGIEPARNIAVVARKRQIPTICDFFSLALAKQLRRDGKRAGIIHAHNVLAHVPALNGVVAGMRELLHDAGCIVIEVPYARDMLDRCEFDTIYHEHLCYFSLSALDRLFARHELTIYRVERVPIHGGSLRLFIAHAASAPRSRPSVARLLQEEDEWGVDKPERYRSFAARVERLAEQLRDLLYGQKNRGRRLAAYGASAKGSTLLNYLRLNPGTIEFVVDRSTVKQGHYTPGTHLPIFAPEQLLSEMPDCVLLLTWNFAEEILQQQAEYRQRGGIFILPIPEVQVV
ncbi:MAG TPA: class I SAM-dependent methyltransferase [Gemmataceae bacterium]|nr:class I SAM-dependent methyltransferase [Gemmataceae bacterium]